MTRDDVNRWEYEIQFWRHRYEDLLKYVSENFAVHSSPPVMLTDKESYEAGRMMGVREEREACAKVCEDIDKEYEGEEVLATWCATAIREREKK